MSEQADGRGSEPFESRPDVVDKARRLVQFLAAAQRLRTAPVRTTDTYEGQGGSVFWLGDEPSHPSIHSPESDAPVAEGLPYLVVERIDTVPAPTPPPGLQPWLDGPWGDANQPPALRESRPELGQGERVTLAAGDHPEVGAAFANYITTWESWAARELKDRPVRQLYRRLFEAYTAVNSQPELLEVILGVGLLSWAPEGHDPVRRHIAVAPGSITFDDRSGTLTVEPGDALEPMSLEFDMLDPALVPPTAQALTGQARSWEGHPLDHAAVSDLLRQVLHHLHPDGRYDASYEAPPPDAQAVLAFAPAVIVRRRSQTGLLEVFQRIERELVELGRVPAGLLPLVDPNYSPPVMSDTTPGAMVTVDEEMFLPLPLNATQLDIIHRVNLQSQTLVQGPPGTGKTHLAAALISHLLAQGKRVLVTAQTDRALKEVRSKLPSQIRPLAVAVLGSDAADMADLKVAVEGIAGRASASDPVTHQAELRQQIEAGLARIDVLRRRRAELRTSLVHERSIDVTEHEVWSYRGTLAGIAKQYLDDSEEHGWLEPLAPHTDADAPLSDVEASRWLELHRGRASDVDETEATLDLPPLDSLPTSDEFASTIHRLSEAEGAFSAFGSLTAHPAFGPVRALDPAVQEALNASMQEIGLQIRSLEHRRDAWIAAALQDVRNGRTAVWQHRADKLRLHRDRVAATLVELAPTTRVSLDGSADPESLHALAINLRESVTRGKPVALNADGSVKIGWLTSPAVKASIPLFDAVRIDGVRPTTAPQLTQVIAFLEAGRLLTALEESWPSTVEMPTFDSPLERLRWHEDEMELLGSLLSLGGRIAAQSDRLRQLGIPQPDWGDLGAVSRFADFVKAAAAHDHLARIRGEYESVSDQLRERVARTAAAQTVQAMQSAVDLRDPEAYASAHSRLHYLHETADRIRERDLLDARIRQSAPEVANRVVSTLLDPEWDSRLASLTSAWGWVRAGRRLRQFESRDTNLIQAQLDITESDIRHQVELLAGHRAWAHALAPARLTGRARADLSHYATLVKRLGKGTGKYAAVRKAEIRRAMDNCRPAVPVWIMPIYRIAEQLRVAENMFDVVIVDEASQAGLEATFLQYLAPKIVVIGDDKQVSPSAVGIDQQELRDLAQQYLYDHRYKEAWQDPKLSLFDAAFNWYGSKRTLTEHRRCVPEIIGFSNRIAYEPDNIRLTPVRQFGADRLPPVKAMHVPTGYETGRAGSKTNAPEADAIVAQIVECIADPRYAGKTMGVISLLGPTQAKLINTLLLDKVEPEEWAARDLRCGDAAAFQGSERDIMFLSMVSAPEPGQRMGARTDEAGIQRYNVAASRAKDQMWVFHSVQSSQLTNPEDLRFRLLDYCYNTVPNLQVTEEGTLAGLVPEDDRVEPFDSLFEQRVHNRLVERGFTLTPQFEVMGYRIDLVVVGAHTRLAVECDGDHWHGPDQYLADLGRERDLRRAGWEFFRLRESSFYVDEHVALAPLWRRLEDLEIRPRRGNSASSSVTPESPVSPATPGSPDTSPASPTTPPSSPLITREIAPETTPQAPPATPTPKEQPAALALPTVQPAAQHAPGPPPRSAGGRRFISPPAVSHGTLPPYREFNGTTAPVGSASRRDIELGLLDVITTEGPVLGSRALSAYVAASGGRRVGHVIADELDAALTRLVRQGAVVKDNPTNRKRIREHTFRLPDQPEVISRARGPRSLEDIPPAELAALLSVAAQATGWAEEDLFREALRRLDLVRLTTQAQATLRDVLTLAQGRSFR